MIKVVSFDYWNTLVADTRSFREARWRALDKVLRSYGLSVKFEHVIAGVREAERIVKLRRRRELTTGKPRENFTILLKAVLSRAGYNNVSDALLDKVYGDFVTELMDLCPEPEPGALEVLEWLKSSGKSIAVVSNTMFWPSIVNRKFLKKLGMYKYIDCFTFADEVGVPKPHPRIFLQMCNSLNTTPEEVLHVGDAVAEDFAAALNVGMASALYDKSRKDVIEIYAGKAYIIHALTDIKLVLSRASK